MSSPQLQRQMEPLNTHLGQGCVSLTASISFPESLAPAPDCTCCVRASCPQRQGALAHDPLVKFPHVPTSRRQIPLEERSKRSFQPLLPTCASLSARVADCVTVHSRTTTRLAQTYRNLWLLHTRVCVTTSLSGSGTLHARPAFLLETAGR